ncbi:MAG: DNA-processing protein DprA [Candidatus Omnitrophica bacterium]|jgi:DNA processing protein|nr:DNA-processing protein DprA [Candidatus Omnitrophota bacterium]
MSCDAGRNETLATLAIRSAAGIGSVIGNRLIRTFGSAADALAASDSELYLIEGMRPQILESLRADAQRSEHSALLDLCEKRGIRVLTPSSQEYPSQLHSLEDRPLVLFARGAARWPDRCVALVGTRLSSPTGLRAAREFARFFALRGIGVVSGLARGIDTAAHEGALDCEGVTLAVIGSGLDALYPAENQELAERISRKGTVLSEYLPDEEAKNFNFPVRNRVISGLVQAVIVVEAPRKSGALGTADWALDQGREVMAVPASPYTRSAEGSVDLIKKGAACVTTPEEVLEILGWEAQEAPKEILRISEPAMGIEYGSLLDALQPGEPATADQLADRTGWETPRLLKALSELEMRGAIVCLPGQRWCLR